MQSIKYLLFFLWLVALASCVEDKVHKHPAPHFTKDQLIDANKADSKRESDEIESVIQHHGWEMQSSGTGLRYQFLVKSASGDSAHTGKYAKVKYTVSLLNGTVCYSSDKDGLKEFRIGEDHVESGIHEVIRLMKVGDKMRFVLPSNLAHGLLGDGDKIPPRVPVLYEMELLSLR
jgi:FKBP-type peptidyl-prolyl cis-trans isomerase FkpA